MQAAKVVTRSRGQRSAKRQATLLEAAAIVFGEKGYDAATMTEIAARAQSAIGSLYLYFPTKEVLATALSVQMTDIMIAQLDSLREANTWTSAEHLADQLFDLFLLFQEELPALVALSERPPPGCSVLRDRLIPSICDVFKAARPQISLVKLQATAIVFITLSKTARAVSWNLPPSGRDEAIAQLRSVMRLYLKQELG